MRRRLWYIEGEISICVFFSPSHDLDEFLLIVTDRKATAPCQCGTETVKLIR